MDHYGSDFAIGCGGDVGGLRSSAKSSEREPHGSSTERITRANHIQFASGAPCLSLKIENSGAENSGRQTEPSQFVKAFQTQRDPFFLPSGN
jgi:hypothetical protein